MDISEANEPESIITAELVNRVSQRVAMGIPLKIALAGEGVACEEYEGHLSEHPELAELADVAKLRFIEYAMSVMLKGKDAAANFRWLIGRVFPDVIGSPPENEPKKVTQTIAGVPEELVEEGRAEFHRRCRENDWD